MKFEVGDKVRVLDGSKIDGYAGGWTSNMKGFIGKVGIVRKPFNTFTNGEGYYLDGFGGYVFDGRGLKLVQRCVVIKEEHGKVTARLGNNKVTVEAESLEDGAKDALDKLLEGQHEFNVGDVVEGISEDRYRITKKGWIGRVTNICGDGIIEVYGSDGCGGYHKYDVEAKHFKLKIPKKN